MGEYTKTSENISRTLDSNPKASKQGSISEILQAYKNGTLQRMGVDEEELLQAKARDKSSERETLQRYTEYAHRDRLGYNALIQGVFGTPQRKGIEDDELLQGKFDSSSAASESLVQREVKPNNTGLPDNLKTGIENISGYSMDDVRVHYNSDKPAQLSALAYAQGTDIHVAPGQEQHLPHETWHVVQQKQGRVQPTVQLQGINVNDNEGLEEEADVMSAKAKNQQLITNKSLIVGVSTSTIQRQPMKATVTGTTHLVKKKKRSIYQGSQERTLINGQKIQVETSDRILSRRGPNQEVFHKYDAKNSHEYRWIRVIFVTGKKVEGENLYIRDDTFIGETQIPRSQEFEPSIDHRLRKDSVPPENKFVPINAPVWYERELGHKKKSTAEQKHRKLVATALECSIDKVDEQMRDHANDEDMLMTLQTIGQHMTHVTPWQPESIEADGKDRHEGYEGVGEYFRTSTGHPLHQEYEMYQQALEVYKEDITTQPVNKGWVEVANKVMGVSNMSDKLEEVNGLEVRIAEDPTRIARGPGAVIGNEEMARETARMKQVLLRKLDSFESVGKKIEGLNERIERLNFLTFKIPELKKGLKNKTAEIKKLKQKLGGFNKEKAPDKVDGKTQQELEQELAKMEQQEKELGEELNPLKSELDKNSDKISTLKLQLTPLLAQQKLYKKYMEPHDPKKISKPRTTDLEPLEGDRTFFSKQGSDFFAKRLLKNRRNVKLEHLFNETGDTSDAGGKEHPNLVLEKEAWKGAPKDNKEEEAVNELHDKWKKESGLKTSLQVRGSFGHHRPSISPLADGRVRINPGLYPMSLLQKGIGAAIGVDATNHKHISQEEDFMHREALEVAVEHALNVIHADQGGKNKKIKNIRNFAKHRLMINLLKAQTILKSPIPNLKERKLYIEWLENDFVKTAQVLENLNESTHLLLSARINEDNAKGIIHSPKDEPLLQPGPFRGFINKTFAVGSAKVAIYYVASGMQAITTGAIAAVHYRRTILKKNSGVGATFIPLHPYFEMKDKTAKAAGFSVGVNPETIIADLSPVDTKAEADDQSQVAVKAGLENLLKKDSTLIPVLDATATPLDEVKKMLPTDTKNFIIVESLTKYAQLGSDKALGGRIIVVGDDDLIKFTGDIINPVEQDANMIVSKIWFESMENVRYKS